MSRPKMVSAIRDEGVGTDPVSELVTTLCAAVNDMTKEMKVIGEEVSLLRLQAEEHQKEKREMATTRRELASLREEIVMLKNAVKTPKSYAATAQSKGHTSTSTQAQNPATINSTSHAPEAVLKGTGRSDSRKMTSEYVKPPAKPAPVAPGAPLQGKA